jgi:aspartate/methionine/tyrosine aminotransferase
VGNPTEADLPVLPRPLLEALADPRSLHYTPEPLGLPAARRAVAADWNARGVPISAANIALTASTSEAYSVLFKILCDPGDEILVPAPSYPLLGMLAAFESVQLRSYPLIYAGRWHVDIPALREAITPRTKAIVTVTPNHPTGSYLGNDEFEAMLDLDIPIVSDEVFANYPIKVPEGRIRSTAHATRGLVFALEGLSKLVALPQMKLGWIGVAGDPSRVAEAMARLEWVLDTYLSVGAPIQHALPSLLQHRTTIQNAIQTRVQQNLEVARQALKRARCTSILEVEGGWYAIVRVPETRSDEAWALDLLETADVLVQPGYFFDMHRGAHVVVSLLTPAAVFAEGMDRFAAYLGEATL